MKQEILEKGRRHSLRPTVMTQATVNGDCNLSISLIDCLGREIKPLLNDSVNKGNNQLQFDVSAIPSGLYMIRFKTSSGFMKTEKMVINH